MKKLIVILTVTVIVFMCFFGCSSKEKTQTTTKLTTTTQPTTVKAIPKAEYKINFESLPDIEEYETFQNKYFYPDGALDEYTPDENYGWIVPYLVTPQDENLQNNKRTKEPFRTTKYGFATVDGKIITKPVYSEIDECTYDSKTVYYYRNTDSNYSYTVLAADGSWIHRDIHFVADGVFITNYMDIYDFDNNYICSFSRIEGEVISIFYDSENVFVYTVNQKAGCYNIKSGSYIDIPYFTDMDFWGDFYVFENEDHKTMYNKEMVKCSDEKYSELLKSDVIAYDNISKTFMGYKSGKVFFYRDDGTKINRNYNIPKTDENSEYTYILTAHSKKNTSVIFTSPSDYRDIVLDWIDIKTGKCMIKNPEIFEDNPQVFICENYVIFYGNVANIAYVYKTSGELVKKIYMYPLDTVNYNCYRDLNVGYHDAILNPSLTTYDINNKNTIKICYDDFKKNKSVDVSGFKCMTDAISIYDNNIAMANIDLFGASEYASEKDLLLCFINSEKIYSVISYTFNKSTVNGKELYSFSTGNYSYLTDNNGNILIKTEGNIIL